AAIWEGFKNHYRGLAGYYNNLLDSKNPQEKQWGILFCRWEYENLFNALQICLEKQENIGIFFCLHNYFVATNDVSSRLKLCESVCQACQTYPEQIKTGIIGSNIVGALGNLAIAYNNTKNYEQAKQTYLKVIELTQNLQGVDEQQKASILGTTYHNLGRVAQELREWEQARSYYQQAIEICIEYGAAGGTQSARYSQARPLHQLGWVAQELREWEQARSYYQQAIEIFIEYGDRFSQASTLHNLGAVAQELREWEQARSYYQQAIEIYIEYGAAGGTQSARFSQASTLHNLGAVAQELREWEQARSYYQQAIEIKIEYGDRYEQAGTLHQLGGVAEGVGELSQAKSYYLQALQIWAEFKDSYAIQTYSLPCLVDLYQQTQDEEIFVAAADILGVGVEDSNSHFETILRCFSDLEIR
ncbi:MAG: tetratricopeptide repeat protein, partial [Microcystis panniformis]